MSKKEPIELEAWYISATTYAKWPSGRYGIAITAKQPFKITKPSRILYFNEVAQHNEWLKKIDRSEAEANGISKTVLSPAKKDKYLKERAIADDKIGTLNKELASREGMINAKDEELVVLKSEVEDLQKSKENLEKMEAKIRKLESALKKKKAAEKAKSGGVRQ